MICAFPIRNTTTITIIAGAHLVSWYGVRKLGRHVLLHQRVRERNVMANVVRGVLGQMAILAILWWG